MRYTKNILLSLTIVVLLATSFIPTVFAKTPPDKLRIIDFSNGTQFIINNDLVSQTWAAYSPMSWTIGSFEEKKDILGGLSKYGFQFMWSDNRGSMPVTYYYVSDEFPDAPAKESFLVFPGDNPTYVSRADQTFNNLIHTAYVSAREPICQYYRLMTVESPDASIFDDTTNTWVNISQWLSHFGTFQSMWTNVSVDNTDPTYFLTAIKWRIEGSIQYMSDSTYNALAVFNSLSPDMKKGRELSMYLIRGYCVVAEGKEFGVETETSYNIRDISFSQQDKKLSYVVATGNTTRGLFKVTIPQELLTGEFTVVVDGKPHYISESVAGGTNGTHTSLTYWHEGSARNIEVIGTEVIPEFPIALLILSALIAGLIAMSRFKIEELK